mmetsp:Transcript_15010/g.42923  ORF Transcript_15010/g.42923 Transcript_15010/m.42923 type:complete len:236 (-) Transcript_15010:581-1288(-)
MSTEARLRLFEPDRPLTRATAPASPTGHHRSRRSTLSSCARSAMHDASAITQGSPTDSQSMRFSQMCRREGSCLNPCARPCIPATPMDLKPERVREIFFSCFMAASASARSHTPLSPIARSSLQETAPKFRVRSCMHFAFERPRARPRRPGLSMVEIPSSFSVCRHGALDTPAAKSFQPEFPMEWTLWTLAERLTRFCRSPMTRPRFFTLASVSLSHMLRSSATRCSCGGTLLTS